MAQKGCAAERSTPQSESMLTHHELRFHKRVNRQTAFVMIDFAHTPQGNLLGLLQNGGFATGPFSYLGA